LRRLRRVEEREVEKASLGCIETNPVSKTPPTTN
jgi:hypothetical protein